MTCSYKFNSQSDTSMYVQNVVGEVTQRVQPTCVINTCATCILPRWGIACGANTCRNNAASIVVVVGGGGGVVVVVVGGGVVGGGVVGGGVVGVVLVHFHQCNPDTVQGMNGERDFLLTHRHRSLLPVAFSFALFRNTKEMPLVQRARTPKSESLASKPHIAVLESIFETDM